MMVLTMVLVIWQEVSKVRVEADTTYGSNESSVIVGKYLWGNLQAHIVIDDFLRTQFSQHPEVAPQITIYLFEYRAPQMEVSTLKHILEAQERTMIQMENNCKELRSRVYLLT